MEDFIFPEDTLQFEDPLWKDIIPVPQDDGPNPIVPINYPPEFRVIMDYFRALIQMNEFSLRGIWLTQELLAYNAANYTAWNYRRKCLFSLGVNLHRELEFVNEKAIENAKNYQIWYHRRALLEKIGTHANELEFLKTALDDDSKNYHAWAHRQWVVKTFNLWDGELDFIVAMLENDNRNNSAWSHRWFVIHQTGEVTNDIIQREIDFAFYYIEKNIDNESPWVYLQGYFKSIPYSHFPDMKEKCEQLKSAYGDNHGFLLSALINIYEQENRARPDETLTDLYQQIIKIDSIREKYWRRKFERAVL